VKEDWLVIAGDALTILIRVAVARFPLPCLAFSSLPLPGFAFAPERARKVVVRYGELQLRH
jgi:hypothetical protein